MDFELSELHESYMAADKYWVHEFHKDFFEYIKSRLSAENSCLIYDQLIKIGEREELTLAHVRSTIVKNSKEALKSEHFTQIDQETLISLLSLDELSIDEFDLFLAVSKWVDYEVRRKGLLMNDENRKRVFKPIKGYIVFDALSLEQITNCLTIISLLTKRERGSLLLQRLNRGERRMIELKTSRRAKASACDVLVSKPALVKNSYPGSYTRWMCLSANRKVSITRIHSTYSGSAAYLTLTILDSDGVDLGLKTKISFQNGKGSFQLNPHLTMMPGHRYILQITGDELLTQEDLMSNFSRFNDPNYAIFEMGSYGLGSHFIESLTYSLPDWTV